MASAKKLLNVNAKHLEGFDVFVFGSSQFDDSPNDLDLLFVYDDTIVKPANAYFQLRPALKSLRDNLELPIHHVVLSLAEDQRTEFSSSVRATTRLRSREA